MDQQGRFRRAAQEAGIPDDETDRFLAHLRLAVRLSGGADGVAVGQCGGSPRLPHGQAWPRVEGEPLPFVLSVDCAALPRVDGTDLPADGVLLFFLDAERDHLAVADGEESRARVVYVPAGTDTAVAPPPAGLDAAGEGYALRAGLVARLPGWFPSEDADEEDEDDLSPFQRQRAEDLERDLPHLDDLGALADRIWPPGDGLAGAYLGGYVAEAVIESIAEQVLAGREKAGEIEIPVAKWASHVEREAHRLAGEWMSLARFAVDDDYYTGCFVIRRDDLAAGRLDRALSVTTFSE